MDTTLSTDNAAIGGSPDTGAKRMSGVEPGRFHTWKVRVPSCTPSSHPPHHMATGQFVAGSLTCGRTRPAPAPGTPPPARIKAAAATPSLDPASLEAIRKVATELASRTRGRRRSDTAADIEYRTRVDVALCSTVFEVGLGYAEAAGLRWGDLQRCRDGSGLITIRSERTEGPAVIPVSAQTFADLDAIVCSKEADKPVFELDGRQIGDRVRSITHAAGFTAKLVRSRRLPTGCDGAPSAQQAPSLQPSKHWLSFASWCQEKERANLPASDETLVAYLQERAATMSASTRYRVVQAITRQHLDAGHGNPFADPTVIKTLKDLHATPRRFRSQMLGPNDLDLIRATAFQPRLRGLGMEYRDTARHRGLVDIALCAVIQAAHLSAEEAAELRWSDLQQSDGDSMCITVRRKSRLETRPRVVELTGQVVCDLMAIRGEAEPDEKVFKLSAGSLRTRVRRAAQDAGIPT